MRTLTLAYLVGILVLVGCQSTPTDDSADLVIWGGPIYTVDKNNPKVEAFSVKANRIHSVGSKQEMESLVGPNTQVIDLKGRCAIPGFIEGHGHYSGLGYSMINLNLMKTKNWEEIVQMVKDKADATEGGAWIEGRGWHQEKWDKMPDVNVYGYPHHDELSVASPNNPVVLRHASGHSLFANEKAMEMAGVSVETPNPKGGRIVRDQNGKAIGVFEEKAMGIIMTALQDYRDSLSQEKLEEEWYEAVRLAEQECLENGITSFQDAGSKDYEIQRYLKLAEEGKMNLRLWAMIRHPYAELKSLVAKLPIIDAGNHFFTCRAIKTQVDGALGAYGAWLLKPYHDKPGFYGQNTTPISEVDSIAQLAMEKNLQVCVHAIGDRANREVLNIFENVMSQEADFRDYRWRMEHAQHVNVEDIPRFGPMGIIASMQGIHCTSDAPFVEKRLGKRRAQEESYAWRTFYNNGVTIANGTDAPVEDVSAIACFYASVTRMRTDNGMSFFPEQKMTRMEALRSYTLDNAYAGFEEQHKGSIEPGKLADITILSKDIIECDDMEILDTEVLYTIVDGKIRYQK